jgi:hypothetical protein
MVPGELQPVVLLESLLRRSPAVEGFAFRKSCSLDRLAEAAIVNLVAHFDSMVQGQGPFYQESLRDRHSFRGHLHALERGLRWFCDRLSNCRSFLNSAW